MSIAELEAELSRQQSINYELHAELDTIAAGVGAATASVEALNAQVRTALDDSAGRLEDSHGLILRSIELQGEIERQYVLFKNMELANKKIRACNNKKYYEFAHYRTVRKLVQGMMDNLDVHMVGDATVYKSIEKEHLQTPDYWLTSALIAIMAWKNDDKALADRALRVSMQLSQKDTAVFMMIFNLRMHREQAALKWFMAYQQCELKGADRRTFLLLFSLISRTLNRDDQLDEAVINEIVEFIGRVVDADYESEGYNEDDIIMTIRRHLDRMKPRDELPYETLRQCCTEYARVADLMMQAKNNINILEFILRTVNVPPEQRNEFLKNFLQEQIDQPNRTEQEVYDEIEYNETIIRCSGDKERADAIYEAERARRVRELNLIAEMIRWVYTNEDPEVNGQMRLNMFTLTRDLNQAAIEDNVSYYRAQDVTHLDIRIGDYTTKADFDQPQQEDAKVRAHYEAIRDGELAQIKALPAILAFVVAAGSAAGAFFAGWWLLGVAACGVGFGVFTLISNNGRRKNLIAGCEASIQSAQAILARLFEEHRAYRAEMAGYDAYYDRILAALDQVG